MHIWERPRLYQSIQIHAPSSCCLHISVTDLILEKKKKKSCGGRGGAAQSREACRENPAKHATGPLAHNVCGLRKHPFLPARVPEWKTSVSDGGEQRAASSVGRKDLDAQQLQGVQHDNISQTAQDSPPGKAHKTSRLSQSRIDPPQAVSCFLCTTTPPPTPTPLLPPLMDPQHFYDLHTSRQRRREAEERSCRGLR